jgi:ribonuclease HI
MPTIVVHTDGGSRGNPGPAAAGVVILNDEQLILESGLFLGNKTNNEAEYQAVIHALSLLPDVVRTLHPDRITWKLDSMLVVQQLSRKWKIKEPRMAEFASRIWSQLDALPVVSEFTYVPRAENAAADAVVNKTLDDALAKA